MADSLRNQDDERRPIVQWFGAHPVENIASMEVYREGLLAARQDDDEFVIRTWPAAGSWHPTADFLRGDRLARWDRAMKKYLAYPLRVRHCPGDTELVHLLDHSIAHLMPHLPKNVKTVVTVARSHPAEFSR